MKKIISSLILFTILIFIMLLTILSTLGIETNKFNRFITDKTAQEKNIKLTLNTIKYKINLKELSLFLETNNPKISYRDISVPAKNIRVYINFLSLLKSDPKIEKINIILEELNINQINNISMVIKPSNFKSILNNKIKKGKLVAEIDFFLSNDGNLKDFIAKGAVKDLQVELFTELNFKKSSFDFFADKNDILIKNIFGDLDDINIFEGDLKINLEEGIKITSNFNSKFNLDKEKLNNHIKFLVGNEIIKDVKKFKGNFKNNLYLDLDSTYKIRNYDYKISGKLEKAQFDLFKHIKKSFIDEKIETIYFSDVKINSIFNPIYIKLDGEGKYSLNNSDFLKLDFENYNEKDSINLKLNFDFKNSLRLDLINYFKSSNSIAAISLDMEKKKDNINIKRLNFKEGKNLINLKNIEFEKNQLINFEQLKVFTEYNDFSIQKKKKFLIKGKKFDATKLAKFFDKKKEDNQLKNLSGEVEIDFQNIKIPMSEELKDFKLIGEVKRGEFIKISSKGDFGRNNFLDISMKKGKNNNKKYLEIYSDLTKPMLAEYSFFKGLSGGKLFYTSIIDDGNSNSKLSIENFKVINAPGLVKLLSLADLGGLADLVEGEGLSFDILEIDMEKNRNFLKLNEILALGPSMSVLMEGYQDENNLISLRGTLVPAKTLNNMISKIPVIGKIVIPKEVGEGLFGISFKIKGLKGNIKTTINPIRTLTPRFIQKIIDKRKTSK